MPNSIDVEGTILTISGIDFPPWSARGLKQKLEVVGESKQLQRTVDGEMDDLSTSQFRKYRSTISCTDVDVPAIDGLFPGQEVVVDCIVELSYMEPGTPPEDEPGESAARPVVPGSVIVANGFVRYRPRLTMLVEDISIQRNEWQAETNWSVDLVEK